MSLIDALVDAQAKEAGWVKPEREVRVCKDRKFRLDYAWPLFDEGNPDFPCGGTAVEIEGGVWMNKSGHNTGKGILRDMEKQNVAVANGWRLIRLTPQQVKAGELKGWLEKMR